MARARCARQLGLACPGIDILVVCTANQCRSPMGEAILRRRLAERGLSANIGSAGFLPGGAPATNDAIATMAEDGLDITAHRSRTVSPEVAGAAELIVTMTRQHVAELAMVAPEAWARAFPLPDLVRRADGAGRRLPDQSLPAWVATLGRGRTPGEILAGRPGDDIDDPIGRPRRAYQRTARTLDELLTRLATLLA